MGQSSPGPFRAGLGPWSSAARPVHSLSLLARCLSVMSPLFIPSPLQGTDWTDAAPLSVSTADPPLPPCDLRSLKQHLPLLFLCIVSLVGVKEAKIFILRVSCLGKFTSYISGGKFLLLLLLTVQFQIVRLGRSSCLICFFEDLTGSVGLLQFVRG